jgi:hypothetical protein
LPSGSTAVVSLAYTVPANVGGGPRLFSVAVSSPTNDPDPSKNAGLDATTVIAGVTPPLPDTAAESLARFASASIGFAFLAATVIGLAGAAWVTLRRRRPA